MIRLSAFGLAAVLLAGATAAAAAMGPVAVARKFMQYANSENPADTKAALALCAKETSVIDEFAPHLWTGDGACQHWFDGFVAWMKSADIEKDQVTLGPTAVADIDGDTAYVVFPATETWTHAGAAMTETARFAFTFKKDGGEWVMTGTAWDGGKPRPATTAKPATP